MSIDAFASNINNAYLHFLLIGSLLVKPDWVNVFSDGLVKSSEIEVEKIVDFRASFSFDWIELVLFVVLVAKILQNSSE